LLGRVEEKVTREWWESGRAKGELTVTVSVVELFKGAKDAKAIQLSAGPGTCMMNFNAGNIYLIFAYASVGSDSRLQTDMCSSAIYEYDPPGAGYENAKLRDDYATVLHALRNRYQKD
tara:strand:+ start:1490 stop:1843 length:354 start_codon:yes stop_codon:yes gene_type:complete